MKVPECCSYGCTDPSIVFIQFFVSSGEDLVAAFCRNHISKAMMILDSLSTKVEGIDVRESTSDPDSSL